MTDAGDDTDGRGGDSDAAGDGAAEDVATEVDAADEAPDAVDVDWQMAPDSDAEFPDDPERREFLRHVGDEIRARDDSSEAEQVAAFVYRVSDLYDAEEDTSPAEIYLNMRHIILHKYRK